VRDSPPTFQVSQGSAATDLRWGENFNKFLFRNSLLNIVVKKLRKSVNFCQSYQKNKSTGGWVIGLVYSWHCTASTRSGRVHFLP